MPTLFHQPLRTSRQKRLIKELRQAWMAAPAQQKRAWVRQTSVDFGSVLYRRGKNLVRTASWADSFLISVGVGAAKEAYGKRFIAPAKETGVAAQGALKEKAGAPMNTVVQTLSALQDRPSETVPELIVGFLAFLVSSGGLNGDGGLPDLDLVMGIDAHRSFLTHSVVSGAVFETSLMATPSLIELLHAYLPAPHDPIWDVIQFSKD